MEDDFKRRVDRTFGTLISSSTSSSSSQPIHSSLWSLTDEELEKNQWAREHDHPLSDDASDDDDEFRNSRNDAAIVDRFFLSAAGENPNSISAVRDSNPNPNRSLSDADVGKEMEGDIDELDEEEDDDAGEGEGGESGGGREGDEGASLTRVSEGIEEGDDVLDVRNSIGLDSTLDFEEEEDAYDKVAVGKEEAGERLYMNYATDYTSHIDSLYEIPTTFKEASRDARANHLAAKLRLKEDAETARTFNFLHVSEKSSPAVSAAPSNACNDGNNIKSILKRKESQIDSKSDKRVRFDSSCKETDGGEYEAGENVTSDSFSGEITLHEGVSSELQQPLLIPDYVRNPSKYTHYTFDSLSDMNEVSNRQAYADFLSMRKKANQSEVDEVPADLSVPVVFNPKKKPCDASAVTSNETDHTMGEPVYRKRPSVSIVAGDELEEACEMEIDEQAITSSKDRNGKRTGRQYRSKRSLDHDESDS